MRIFPWPIAIILAGLAIVIFVLYQDKDFKGSIVPHQPSTEDQVDIEELLSQLEIDKSSLIGLICSSNKAEKQRYRIFHVLKVHPAYLFKETEIEVSSLNCTKKELGKVSKKIAEIVEGIGIKVEMGKITRDSGKWQRIINVQQKEITLEQCRKIFNEYVKYFHGFQWFYYMTEGKEQLSLKRGSWKNPRTSLLFFRIFW